MEISQESALSLPTACMKVITVKSSFLNDFKLKGKVTEQTLQY